MMRTAIFLLGVFVSFAECLQAQETKAPDDHPAQPTFLSYVRSQKVTEPEVDYSINWDFVLAKAEDGSWKMTFRKQHWVFGCVKESFTYTDVYVERAVPAEKAAKLYETIRSMDLKGYAYFDGSHNPDCGVLLGTASYAIPATPEGLEIRDKLWALVDGFPKPGIESAQKTHVIEGDLTPPQTVALRELLAHPEKYEGKRVRVSGYYSRAQFGYQMLAVNKSALSQKTVSYKEKTELGGFSKFAKSDEARAGKVSFNNCYVTVEGSFHGSYIGRITKLTKDP